MMRYCNCFIGALYLKLRYGGKLRVIRTKEKGPRHWVCKLPSGEVWHFKRDKYILPGIFRYLIFPGKFEKLENKHKNAS